MRGVDIAIVEMLEPLEPRTTEVLVGVLRAARERGRRAWVVRSSDGRVGAVVAIERLAFDHRHAAVHISDASAADTVGRLIDVTGVHGVSGSGADIEPIISSIERRTALFEVPMLHAAHPVGDVFGDADAATRFAGRRDLGRLVDFYSAYELKGFDTRWQLRQYLRRRLSEDTVVIHEDADGTIVGGIVVGGRTRQYALLDQLSVEPGHRSAGVARSLFARLVEWGREHGVGGCGGIAPTNAMNFDRPGVSWVDDALYHVVVRRPRRIPGHGRLRRTMRRIRPLTPRPAELVRPATARVFEQSPPRHAQQRFEPPDRSPTVARGDDAETERA